MKHAPECASVLFVSAADPRQRAPCSCGAAGDQGEAILSAILRDRRAKSGRLMTETDAAVDQDAEALLPIIRAHAADLVPEVRQILANRAEMEKELKEAKEQRLLAETAREAELAPRKRIADVIAEAEKDGTIPHDRHCGEAIVLQRIRDALKAEP